MTHNAQMSKRRKMNSVTVKDQTMLTDLNADCLRIIIKHLNEIHLLNLVEANLTDCQLEKTFNSETNERTHPYEATIRDRFLQFGRHIFSNDPEKMLHYESVLRYFGSLLSKITLDYDTQFYRYNNNIEKLILEYCAPFVTSIKFVNADKFSFENIDKPFAQVNELTFERGFLSKILSQFNRWFPRLNSFNVLDTSLLHSEYIELFSNLKEFSVKGSQVNWENLTKDFILTNINFKKLIEMNPQLEKLHITSDHIRIFDVQQCDLNNNINLINSNSNIKFFSNHVRLLRYLKLYISSNFDLQSEIINFEHLKRLSVVAKSVDQLPQLNIKCEQLVELKLYVGTSYPDCKIISDFVGRFKNLNSLLCLGLYIDVCNQHFTTMIKGLHNLKTLHITIFDAKNLSNYLFHCVGEFDQLTTLKINCYNFEGYESVLNGLNESDVMKKNKWKGILLRDCPINLRFKNLRFFK